MMSGGPPEATAAAAVLDLYYANLLSAYLDRQLRLQLAELQLIEIAIQQSERSEAEATELPDERGAGGRKCGRPVSNEALEARVKEFVKYLENRGIKPTRPLCRMVIEEVSGEEWSYGWARKFLVRYFKERKSIAESSNVPLAEHLFRLAGSRRRC